MKKKCNQKIDKKIELFKINIKLKKKKCERRNKQISFISITDKKKRANLNKFNYFIGLCASYTIPPPHCPPMKTATKWERKIKSNKNRYMCLKE